MFNLPYYMRQRITKRATDVVMVVFLIITLFPIFWMVFSSFKSNTEILLGKIPFGRASNDAVYMEQRGKSLFVLTADGGLNKFDISTNELIKRGSIKSMATSYITDDVNIWAGSSDKGLVQISMDDLSKKRRFDADVEGKDISKIVSTFLLQDENTIYMGFQQKGVEKLYKFDKPTRTFSGTISFGGPLSPCQAASAVLFGGQIWIGTNKGLIVCDKKTGQSVKTYNGNDLGIPPVDIKKMVLFKDEILLSTSSGIFGFSPSAGKVIKIYNQASGLLSDRANNILTDGNRIFAGLNNGLSIIDTSTGNIKNIESLFVPVQGSNEKGFVHGDVFGMAKTEKGIMLGSSGGRISFLGANNAPSQTLKAGEGHILIRWRNYIDLWKNINFALYLKNSIIICGITMLLAMIFATLAAYSLARFDFPGNKFFSIGVLATQMIPAIMYLIPIYIMFTKFTQWTGVPMKGTYMGLIMIYSAFFIPFSIWILRGFFAAIPVELEEAARIDGASPLQVFWYIVLPLAVPGIIATGIYVFLTAWDELMFAWVLCNADTMTIPVGIRLFVGNYQNRFDLMMAAATVATIPVMVLFFMLQKHIVKGLTAGAVKG
ncbi:MAG: ABC transporter permease subunit [Candidatus Saganbacteria bacterium]|nr:ABC transporter permease subunit [Candidatus Saganbacteria bacterium]